MDEKQLIRAAADGDLGAFRQLYNRHLREVTAHVGKVLGPGPEVEDVVQEVFIQIFRSLRSFQGDSAFSTWVYRVTRNVTISHLRKSPRSVDFVALKNIQAPVNNWARLAAREKVRALYSAMECLTEEARDAFVMYEIEGMTLQEIADVSGTSINTIASRVRRSRQRLLEMIGHTLSATEERSGGEL